MAVSSKVYFTSRIVQKKECTQEELSLLSNRLTRTVVAFILDETPKAHLYHLSFCTKASFCSHL